MDARMFQLTGPAILDELRQQAATASVNKEGFVLLVAAMGNPDC